VAEDDLNAPLGRVTTKKRPVLPIVLGKAIVGGLAVFVGVFAVWALMVDDPLGGEPMVVVSTEVQSQSAQKTDEITIVSAIPVPPPGAAPAAPPSPPEHPPGTQTITIIDGTTGKRSEMVIPAPAAAPAKRVGVFDARLVEASRHGPIPRIAPDGARPADTYARPVHLPKPNAPRVVIVINGLGIGTGATTDAMNKLPGPVTLAFTPYGAEIERAVARARGAGHEVLLQVPMEPVDYPDNDPGPQTLLTSLSSEQNLDRLHWLMSRFQGYVGITNVMGARFTATDKALAPVLREAGKRGLLYLDDGSSPGSLAGRMAGTSNVPFAKAEVTIDATPTAAEIDRALARLEAMARERGVAIGIASALPITIARITQWAKSAESRGFALVPVSAVVTKAKAS
jgi:polysaccharide deacetylase 2 family uncharacterized protein YibQ